MVDSTTIVLEVEVVVEVADSRQGEAPQVTTHLDLDLGGSLMQLRERARARVAAWTGWPDHLGSGVQTLSREATLDK